MQILPSKAEKAEDKRHLESVGEYGEKTSADSGVAHPEGGESIPEHECAVMPEPETSGTVSGRQPFKAQERYKSEKGQKPRMRNKPRQAHHH